MQTPVHRLITQLCDRGKEVLIETSGACDISRCDPRAIRILDFKTPGSGEADRNLWSNVENLTQRDEVKFVITDRADYDWAKSVIQRHKIAERCGAILMSPVFEQSPGEEIAGCAGLDPQALAQWMLDDPLPGGGGRLQLQLHKFIWSPCTRGV